MSYIGSSAAPQFLSFSGVRSQSFNGDGTTTAFNLNRPVDNVTSVEVLVNNVQQSPFDSSYSVSGSTLTFSEAPSSGTGNVYVIFRDAPLGSINPLDGSVTTAKLANAAVTAEKIAAGAIPPSDDASALTTGTLPIARIADGAVTAAKLASTLDLTGKTVTLPAGVGGKVLQVVQTVYNTQQSTTSTTYVNTGLDASITPSSTSNKILIFVTTTAQLQVGGRARYTLIRNNTTRLHAVESLVSVEGNYNNNYMVNLHYLDSPSSTSSVSYELQHSSSSANTLYVQVSSNSGIITLMEIAA